MQLVKAKPGGFHTWSQRNRARTMKFGLEMVFFGPNSAIMEFEKKVFP